MRCPVIKRRYPSPQDIGISIPPTLIAERFDRGFAHGVRGGQLDRIDYFRRSFRLGFRAAKLYLRQVRRRCSIVEFPQRFRLRVI